MGVVFFIPLAMIAVYETTFMSRHAWMKHWWSGNDEGEDDRPEYRDPVVDETDGQGLVISKVPFTELVKMFPNTEQVCTIHALGSLAGANENFAVE